MYSTYLCVMSNAFIDKLRGIVTYIRVGAECLEGLSIDGTSEALEEVLVAGVGTASNLRDGVVESSKVASLLELDNVLVGNNLALGADDGSQVRALSGRGAQGKGKNSEED